MTSELYRLYRDIVQHRSMSKAAAENGVTTSAASQRIHDLEEDLQVTLLDRSTRPLTVTPAGKLYYDLCRDVLRRTDEFATALQELKTQVEGAVRVASIYSVGLSEMPMLEAQFHERYPKAALHVEYLRPEKVYDRVREDRADFGLVSYPEPTRQLAVIPWRAEQMAVVVSPNHPLRAKACLRLSDMQGIDFVAFDEDLPIRREIDRFLKEHGVDVNITMHFDNLQTIKEAVALDHGASILPAHVAQTEARLGRIAILPLDPPLYRPVGIIVRKRKKMPRAAVSFLEVLRGTEAGVALSAAR